MPSPLLFLEGGGIEEPSGHSYFNRAEAVKILILLEELVKDGIKQENIGVVNLVSKEFNFK